MNRRVWLFLALAMTMISAAALAEEDLLNIDIDSLIAANIHDFSTMSFDSLKTFAENGDTEAQHYLGLRYAQGTGVAADVDQAMYWIRKSADGGDKWAQGTLAEIFFGGELLPVNEDSGVYWLDKAAYQDNGFSQSQKALYCMYKARTNDDTVTAYMWSNLATYNLYEDFHTKAESLKTIIRGPLTPEQVAKGDSLTVAFMIERLTESKTADTVRLIRNLSKVGWGEAEYREGKMKFFDLSNDTLRQEGVDLYVRAAGHGYAPAAVELGKMYNSGSSPLPMNDDSAFYWFKQGADRGDASGQVWLGYMYATGHGTKKNGKEAFRLYKLSAAQNNQQGIHYLGDAYWSDEAPKKNKIRAWALLNVAEPRGQQVSIVTIGETIRKMNDKERAEAEQLRKDLDDETKIKGIIESWVD